MLVMLTALIGMLAPASQPAKGPASQPAKVPADNLMRDTAMVHRGAKFTLKDSMSLDELAKDAKKFAGKTVKVTGKVKAVCKKKGCWITMAGANPQAKARVTFKDYAFFAPYDAAGTMGTVEGTVEVKTLSEGERKHLADDAGKKLADMPKVELRLMANALEVRRVGH